MKSIFIIFTLIAIASSLPTHFDLTSNMKIPLKSHLEATRKLLKVFKYDQDPSKNLFSTVDKDCIKRTLNLKNRDHDYLVTASEANFVNIMVSFLCTTDSQLANIYNYDLIHAYQDAPMISAECLEVKLSKFSKNFSILNTLSLIKSEKECEDEIKNFDSYCETQVTPIKNASNFLECSDEFYNIFAPFEAYFMKYLQKKNLILSPAEKMMNQLEYVRNYRAFAQKSVNCVMGKLGGIQGVNYSGIFMQ